MNAMRLATALRSLFIPLWYRIPCQVAGILAFLTYLITAEDGISFWDCPEYVTTALRLEIGHPPGNPLWMLTHRVVSLFAPAGSEAWIINVTSGFFMAVGTALLASVIISVLMMLYEPLLRRKVVARLTASFVAAGGALTFGWCDSAWFSAVEAEVYAMSLFLTALSVRLMVGWLDLPTGGARKRRLVLIAYLTGLSIGVHQLNLLCLPALVLIWAFGKYRSQSSLRAWGAIVLGCLVVGVLLLGMMPLTALWSGWVELLCVNRFGWPYGSGAVLSIVVLMGVAFTLPLILKRMPRLPLICWMGAMVLTGYLVWLVIPIRAMASPVMNQGNPSTPFSFAAYLAREQYGSNPLFYGRTPYSRPLLKEVAEIGVTGDTVWRYPDFLRKVKGTNYAPLTPGAYVRDVFGLLSPGDIVRNGTRGYVATGKKYDLVYTPELDMWLPRITASGEDNMAAYAGWAGMTPESMDEVEVSETLDAEGHPAGRRDGGGVRHKEKNRRPTYFQNLRYMLGYQMGYMYFRYLLWNYSGRQNDLPSSGEIDHGNFIMGIAPLDDAMLGPQSSLPPEAGKENPGHHVYYLVPFLLGIAGCVVLARSGRIGRRVLGVSTVLFLMTGLAIVFYLNQTPGEPRERDYSFLGSFWTFSFWIAIGISGLAFTGGAKRQSKWRYLLTIMVSAGVPLWMLAENFPDHNRSGRRIPGMIATNMLMAPDEDAILLVQGDNFTFPVWYMQNVEGMRRDVVIINQSYLATHWYAAQLSSPREDGGAPLAMVGRDVDFAYAQIPFALLPDSVTPAMDGVEALRLMYADTAQVARIPASRLRVGRGERQQEFDLFELFGKGPGGKIFLSQIVMLDILVSNEALDKPRPIYWHRGVGNRVLPGISTHGVNAGPVMRYDLHPDSLYILNRALSTVRSLRTDFMDDDAYLDPYSGNMINDQRNNVVNLALDLETAGRYGEAVEMAEWVLNYCDGARWPFPVTTREGSLMYPGLEIARLLMEYGDRRQQELGASVFESEYERMEGWMNYYSAIPEWRRDAISPRSRNLAAGLTRARELRTKLKLIKN